MSAGAAEKLGELLCTGWPETEKGKLIYFPHLPKKKKGLPVESNKPL
jgi:hypothetical protein